MSEPGWRVVLLLADAFRESVDAVHDELAARGYPDARPLHGFALQAVGADGCTINELGQRLGVTKQAAAKTAATLERAGYLTREGVPHDRRAVRLRRTRRADELLAASAEGFERVMDRWRDELGIRAFDAMVAALATIADDGGVGDLPGWLTQRAAR